MRYPLLLCLIFSFSLFIIRAQESKPIDVGVADKMEIVPSLSSRSYLRPAINKEATVQDGRATRAEVVIGKDPQKDNDYLVRDKSIFSMNKKGRTPSLVFDAVQSNISPTDPSLAVGPDHVFVVYNTGFRIFDKEGNPLTNQLSESNIFPSEGCCDLTVSYDNAADRWVVSLLGNGAFVAVSDGPNPVTSDWYVYNFTQVSDYQKLSVWSDGYYMTDNTSANNKIYVFERDKMLNGDTSAQIQTFPLTGLITDGFYSPQVLNISDDNTPPAGNATVVFYHDDSFTGITNDHLILWNINVDWITPNNSSISGPLSLPTTPFLSVFDGGSFSNLQQPNGGSSIDAIQNTIMNQAQFRQFDSHNSALFSFVVDTDASAGELAGIRWYELRQDNATDDWSIYQEGTYTSPDGKHAWLGSLMMDHEGNIGMGYVGMGGNTNTHVSSYYTGRYADDPLGTMTVGEELIAEGSTNFLGNRYGDYGKLDIDPNNDKEFWYITEYMNPDRKDVVGVFQLAPDFANDVGIVDITDPVSGDLSAAETVTVTIFNYGTEEQSNFPIRLIVDDVTIVDEVFTGTIAVGQNIDYTFSQTIDLSIEGNTYTIGSSTQLVGDEDTTNDLFTKEVTHINANDVGISAITAPSTSADLGTETITVEITNYGTQTQNNIPVQYSINGGADIQETFSGPIQPEETLSYSFDSQANFSTPGNYVIIARTNLNTDADVSNDSLTITVVHTSCFMLENITATPVGASVATSTINYSGAPFTLNDVNVGINITHTYTSDLSVTLIAPNGTEILLTEANGGAGNNYTNTFFDDDATTSILMGSPPFTGTFKPEEELSTLNGINAVGTWTLRIIDTFPPQDSGTLNTWSLELCGSELGIEEQNFDNSNFEVSHKGNKIYQVTLKDPNLKDRQNLFVYSVSGQLLLTKTLVPNGEGLYNYELNMSYAPSGVYFLKLGNYNRKIVVK